MPDDVKDSLLAMSLQVAVPLWIHRLKDRPWSELTVMAAEASQIVAEKGDIILFKGKKKGETAAAFNALARGVAILSFCPGGVTLFGQHWEAGHPEVARFEA